MDAALPDSRPASVGAKPPRPAPAVYSAATAPAVSAFDPRQSAPLTAAQLRALELLHKHCAGRMSAALGAILPCRVEAEFSAVEQLSAPDFFTRLPGPGHLLSFRSSSGAGALLHLDPLLVFPLLELLLGGTSSEAAEARELTEIEQEVLGPLARTLVRCLEEAWQPLLKVTFELERSWAKAEAAARLSASDRLLVVAFQLRLPQAQGLLLTAFPAALSAALLQKLAPPDAPSAPLPVQDRGRLRGQLLEARFTAELLLPASPVSVRELRALQPGDILRLRVPATEALLVQVAGQPRFLAAPVRSGSRRAAQVLQVLSLAPDAEKKNGAAAEKTGLALRTTSGEKP
jgi:flagellar motor switch protein FliM